MSERQAFRPLPDPEPPNFDRLPAGTREFFQRRLDVLPLRRVYFRIGVEAMMTNESRALHQYEVENSLDWEQFAPLGTWHMRAAHDRISAARSDLLAHRRPSGIYCEIGPASRSDRIRSQLTALHLWNFLSGSYTWLRNRAIDIRAASLRLTVRS